MSKYLGGVGGNRRRRVHPWNLAENRRPPLYSLYPPPVIALSLFERQQIARRIRSDAPNLSDEEVKWHVALKLYEREPEVVKLIWDQLSNVSR